nr:hypothetical protein Iba_chr14dCG3770 [Ipomoea batatas]
MPKADPRITKTTNTPFRYPVLGEQSSSPGPEPGVIRAAGKIKERRASIILITSLRYAMVIYPSRAQSIFASPWSLVRTPQVIWFLFVSSPSNRNKGAKPFKSILSFELQNSQLGQMTMMRAQGRRLAFDRSTSFSLFPRLSLFPLLWFRTPPPHAANQLAAFFLSIGPPTSTNENEALALTFPFPIQGTGGDVVAGVSK